MAHRDEFESWALSATGPLFRHAVVLIADRQLAEDLVQETLTKMYVHWSHIDETAQPTAYAKQTLYRLFVSKRRLKSSGELVTDAFPQLVAPDLDVESSIDLVRAMRRLKPAERAVVVARYSEGLPASEVAQLLDRSEVWVRKTASRALAKLRNSSHLARPV
ncbi:sigma-70 family RNA polymerase sigma factor [Tessaracoccus caeni]|uniref:sigma-70 family RNA polymerase sigma factor n=1 Tax=Tessaracoccus caeni TaxID=3031239 RepID=UPI0023D9B006|nr:sigma-70 family RNA polymerase sigma factor [Tessaracoccus caeni]MDF1486887.1 sigma-70 family RNA polymerase sigma factor [Tessaracoccus caeni]